MDGILGLAPDVPENGPSFITMMYNTGLISSKKYTLNLNQAQITFGDADLSSVNGDSVLVDHKARLNWTVEIWDAITYSSSAETANTSFFSDSSAIMQGYVDSFFRPLKFPKAEWTKFANYMMTTYKDVGVTCSFEKGNCYFI